MLPGVATEVIERIVEARLTDADPILVAFAGGIATLAVLYLVGAFAEHGDQQSDDHDDRFFTPRTLGDLVREQQRNTSIVGDGLSERHKGHWKKVQGKVWDVSEYSSSISIFVELTDDEVSLHLNFEPKKLWRDRLGPIAKNDIVTVNGQIDRITDQSVTLENCELLEVRAADPNN